MKTAPSNTLHTDVLQLAARYAQLRATLKDTKYDKSERLTITSVGERVAWRVIDLPLSATKRGRIYVTDQGELVTMHITRLGLIFRRTPYRPLRLAKSPKGSLSKLAWKLREQIDEINYGSAL